MHLFYEQQNGTEARYQLSMNFRKANTNSSALGTIHASCTSSPVEVRSSRNPMALDEIRGRTWPEWRSDRFGSGNFVLMSPGFRRTKVNAEKFVCKLTFQAAPGQNDRNINFRIYVEGIESIPVCGYKLSIVNMLGDIVEAHDFCDNTFHDRHPYYKPEFTALGNP